MNLLTTFGIGAIAACCAIAAEAAPAYHIAQEAAVTGDEGWDYLTADAASGKLYVSHGSKVQILNSADLSLEGEVAQTPGVHGVALAPDLQRGYVSAGRADSVVVFDLKTLARLQEIKTTGANPDAILYEPTTHQVFTFNGRGRNATVIDTKDNAVVATLALDAKPEFAVADLAGHVYVNLEDANSIAVIDAAARKVQATWSLPGCEEPSGLAIDREHARLFSVCANKVMVMVDAKTGGVAATVPIGGRVDGVAFDPGKQMAFASGGDGTLTVVHEDGPQKLSVVQTVTTRIGARTVTLDEKTHRVYTVTAKYSADAAGQPSGRPKILPGTFSVLAIDP